MIVLDTNVLSELLRPTPAVQVEEWFTRQDGRMIYFTTVGEAELRYGLSLLPEGKRRTNLSKAVEGLLDEDLAGRVLSFDRPAASAYAIIAEGRRAAGRPVSQFDCQIAGIARANGAALATRNTKDFQGCGIVVIDPWQKGS